MAKELLPMSELRSYPTNLSDAEWAVLTPVLPLRYRLGRPPGDDRREVINALDYMDRSGRARRALPRGFPEWPTVRYYFDAWRCDGTWERMNATVRRQVRVLVGKEPEPTAAIMDSQSVKTTEAGGLHGYDRGGEGAGAQAAYLGGYLGVSLVRGSARGGPTECRGRQDRPGEWA